MPEQSITDSLVPEQEGRACAPYDARAVANLLLDFADVSGRPLTQMSLLKLIYFAHGWFLVERSKPLVIQEFEAWQRGPVVKVVRDEFREFGKSPIHSRASRLDLLTGKRSIVPPVLAGEDTNFVRVIYESYSDFGAWQLSEMTHESGSPWDKLWNASETFGRLALRIKNDEIRAHFLSLPTRTMLS